MTDFNASIGTRTFGSGREKHARMKVARHAVSLAGAGLVTALAGWSAFSFHASASAAEPARTPAPSTPGKTKGETNSNAGVDYMALQELLEAAKGYGHRKAQAFSCASSQPSILYTNPKIPFLKMARSQGVSRSQLEALGDAYERAAETNYQLVLSNQARYSCDREKIEAVNLDDAKHFDPEIAAKMEADKATMEAAEKRKFQASQDAARESLQKSFQLIGGRWRMHKFEDLGRSYNVPYQLGWRNRCYSVKASDGTLMIVGIDPSDKSIVVTLQSETVETTSCTEGQNPEPDRSSLALKLRVSPADRGKYKVEIVDCRERCNSARALQLMNDGTLVYQTDGEDDIEFQRR